MKLNNEAKKWIEQEQNRKKSCKEGVRRYGYIIGSLKRELKIAEKALDLEKQ